VARFVEEIRRSVRRVFGPASVRWRVRNPPQTSGQGDGVVTQSVQFRRTNKDYDLDWHTAPNRQYVVTLSGESEIELEGGRKLRLGPGHILLAEDTTGQGHISRAIGAGDRISLFIPLADGAVPPR
jgi:hypothetical protein